jgi:hypothetical protein
LPVCPELFQRQQVQHGPGFNASLAQSHHMLSHEWHQRMIRFKAKGVACVREGCGHDRDLLRFEGSFC